jgi:hypothetical protein
MKYLLAGVLLLLSVATLACSGQPADAATLYPQQVNSPPFVPGMVYGQGTKSCGAWTTDAAVPTHDVRYRAHTENKSWVVGYVTGATAGGMRLRQSDSLGMVTFIDQFCQANPLDDISKATFALVKALRAE